MTRALARNFVGMAARWSGGGSTAAIASTIYPEAVPVIVIGEDGPNNGGSNVYSTTALSGALNRPRVRLWSPESGFAVFLVAVLDPNSTERSFRLRIYPETRPDSTLTNDALETEFLRRPTTLRASNVSKPATLGVEGALIRVQNRNGLLIYRPRRPILVNPGQVFEMVGETVNDDPEFLVEFSEGL